MFTDIKEFTSKTSKISRNQLQQLLDLHDKLLLPNFKKYNGNIIKSIGDAFLVSFESPTDCVLCAINIQKSLQKYNYQKNPTDKIDVRIAINSGEVNIKDGDVFGETVNIASRLEEIAQAKKIYITESVYLCMNKNEVVTKPIGYKKFKGIKQKVKIHKVIQSNNSKRNTNFFSDKNNNQIIIFATIFLLLLALILFIQITQNNQEKTINSLNDIDILKEIEKTEINARNAIETNDTELFVYNINILKGIDQKIGHSSDLERLIVYLEEKHKNNLLMNNLIESFPQNDKTLLE